MEEADAKKRKERGKLEEKEIDYVKSIDSERQDGCTFLKNVYVG